MDVDHCVSDSETLCGEDGSSDNFSTSDSMPQLDTASDSEDEVTSDFESREWGCKILPKPQDLLRVESKHSKLCRRFYSTECESNKSKEQEKKSDLLERRSMPPKVGHLDELPTTSQEFSCRHSQKSSVSSKSDASSLNWIDKTPSENSLQLPFCPPVKIDFEDFDGLQSKPLIRPRNTTDTDVTINQLQSSPSAVEKTVSTENDPPCDVRNSSIRQESEISIIPLVQSEQRFPELNRPIASPVIPLSPKNFVSHCDVFTPPERNRDQHYVEIIIQISPPLAFSSPILPPPPNFSSTITRPNFPKAFPRHSAGVKPQDFRASFRDSGLADISPSVRRKKSSSHSAILSSTSPTTSGLSSEGFITPYRDFSVQDSTRSQCNCCFFSRDNLSLNLFEKRKNLLHREKSQSLDDSAFPCFERYAANESENALSCIDLPFSSLASDAFEGHPSNRMSRRTFDEEQPLTPDEKL